MELNFQEINNLGNQVNLNEQKNNTIQNDLNEIKYWEQPKIEKPKKKKVSFDDILNNMNLVVRADGALQYMQPLQQNQTQDYYSQNFQNQYSHQPTQYTQNSTEPINPAVKHSYIYNKYFKNYNDTNSPRPGPRRPKTIEELKQMIKNDKIREIQQRIRIAQIKPKKMLFTNINVNVNRIQATKNNLRSMEFK